MKIAIILVATAGLGLAGYTLHAQFGGGGPDAVVVTLPQRAGEAAVRSPLSEPQKAVATPGDRASLARELQRELQRVGCYEGEISGAWTTSARLAMKAFTDRVNASLPIDAPDYILLSLVQRHQGKACGAGCPAGQSPIEDGRCVPSAVLAKAGKASVPAEPKIVEAKVVDKSGDKAPADKGGVATNSWAPTAGLAPELRSPPIRGNAALAVPKSEPSAMPQDHPKIAAAKPEPEPPSEPVLRARRAPKRSARRDGPVPQVGVYENQPRRKYRSAKSKPPKVVRKFLRSMQRSLAGLPR